MKFAKLSATGNHFVALWPDDARGLDLPDFARKHCSGHDIGADGVIVPLPAGGYDFAFTYYNYMGDPVPFCGNAARALPFFARKMGLVDSDEVRFLANDRAYAARVGPDGVWLDLGGLNFLEPGEVTVVDAGVRHGVVFVENLEAADILALRERLGSPPFHLNFAEVLSPGMIFVRTLEFGYPEEPLSCATGAISASLVHARENGLREVKIITKGGRLRARFAPDFSVIALFGPVKVVYLGWLVVSPEQ